MYRNNIIDNENSIVDKLISKFILMLWMFFAVIWILNVIGIFVVEQNTMNAVFCAVSIVYAIPFWVITLKKNCISGNKFRYFISIMLNLSVGILYTFLTFHTIAMFIYPVLVISIYGNKKLSWFTVGSTSLIIVLSHWLSLFFNVVPEEPFTDLKSVMLYGMLPRLVQYIMFAIIFMTITHRNHNMMTELSKAADDMFETQNELVKAFAEISESKSGQTGQHIKRVSEYVDIMAEYLGIEGNEREALSIAAMLHDIGKLNVPDEILEKPGKLTAEEFNIIKRHVTDGFKLLEHSPGRIMEIGKVIALEHHERWDGNGYLGKSGEDINFYARIMSIADVFDALVSKRSYKEPWSADDAKNEIILQKGKQFDPKLVDVFEKCYPKFVDIINRFPN